MRRGAARARRRDSDAARRDAGQLRLYVSVYQLPGRCDGN